MSDKVRFYSLYERIWHWIQGLAVLVLLISGFEISYAGRFSATGFQTAVELHNVVGMVLLINAFLALFYNLAGGLISRYIPKFSDVFPLGFDHARYYLIGIFKGQGHPFDKTPEKRLLPLQKLTYFLVLNILLPLMAVTGFLKLVIDEYPTLVNALGGLAVLGPIHRFGAWMFLVFLIVHIYMTTTGHTLWANLKSMITGYGHLEQAGKKTGEQEND